MIDRRLLLSGLVAGISFPSNLTGSADASTVSASTSLGEIARSAARANRAGAIIAARGCGLNAVEAAGVAVRRPRVAMPTDQPLRLGSIGKMYVAALIVRLAEAGKLDLQAPVDSIITLGKLDGVAGRSASIMQVLNHTSGVRDYYTPQTIATWDWRQPITPDRVFAAVRGLPAANAPGAGYHYSNTGYHILGLIGEAITGTTLAEALKTFVFAPAELTSTTYHTTNPGGIVHGYGTPLSANADTWTLSENTGADSGITAPPSEVIRFLEALLLPGGSLYATGQAMMRNPVAADRERRMAGLGVEIATGRDGTVLVGHTGDVEGYLSFAYVAPAFGAALFGHINARRPEVLSTMLRSAVDQLKVLCSPVGR
jgi:D-alanyl-D-alanine carboxypeptidase